MQSTTILRLAALFGATAVLLGAFAAHGLKGKWTPEALTVFETGVRYQMYHALALGLCAVRAPQRWAPLCFTAGILLFSGSLYLLAWSDVKWLGAITPLGGVAFVVGWCALGVTAGRAAPRADERAAMR